MKEALLRAGINIGSSIASRAKCMLDDEVYGRHDEGFQAAGDMLRRISDANPGAVTDLWLDERDPLKREFRGAFLMLPFSIVSRPHSITYVLDRTLFLTLSPFASWTPIAIPILG
jgi:hypothetical protein